MNLHDLTLVGFGAVIALIFTGIAKWLFSIFDAVIPVSKAPERIRTIFSVKANRSLFWTALFLLYEIGSIVWFALDKRPITRLSVLFGAFLVCMSILLLPMLMWEVLSALRRRRRAKGIQSA